MTTQAEGAKQGLWDAINANLLRPIQALRLAYLPLLMVYFAYGARSEEHTSELQSP